MSTTVTVTFGQAPAPAQEAPLPAQPTGTPPELLVTRHLVGYTEVSLSNGDVLRLHLHVGHLAYDPQTGSFAPEYRVVPEVVKRAFGWNCRKLEGPLS